MEETFSRFAAEVEYDGTSYHGWQSQVKNIATIQDEVEKALSIVADEDIKVICAGRTDAGVHATGQIIHFDTKVERSLLAWTHGSNANLPNDISFHWVKSVPDDFHARFKAISRRYCYTIYNDPIRPVIARNNVTWQCLPLDEKLMHEAGQALVGEHNFNSFRAKNCQAHSPIRTIESLNVTRRKKIITIEIQANAFLHHMVRNIAGVLMAIGSHKEPVSWVEELLSVCSREQGGVTAKPTGLCLMHVGYPEEFIEISV